MRGTKAILEGFWPRKHGAEAEPGARMFGRLRSHLTLWYSAVLAGMLIVFGIVLYLSVQQMLFEPVKDGVIRQANQYAANWQADPLDLYGCTMQHHDQGLPPPNTPPQIFNGQVFIFACYNPNTGYVVGNVTTGNETGLDLSNPFLADPLFKQAIENGTASDTINCGSEYGDVYRYAEVVPSPTGNGILGVVQVGGSVSTQESVMNLLLILLLILGVATLLAAGLGGFLLAERALVPARLAFTRQQAFIADASHELRTPLTLMRADAELLLHGRKKIDPDDAALLEDIVSEAGHMAALANNMLTLARLDAGRFHMERDVVDLAEVANDVVKRVQALAQERGVTVQMERGVQALVLGDRVLLEQVALILVDNAIKYNRSQGSVRVRAFVAQGQAYLEVADTGIGIASEHLPHLGERFYRVDKARSREAGGAGLGLSIARSVAASHQGTLTLTSVPGQGTTALLSLPAALPANQPKDGQAVLPGSLPVVDR